MDEVCEFLKKAETYFLATIDGDQPRVRPFGTAHIYEGKLYIQTGKSKAVSKQIAINPKVELCAWQGMDWLRVTATMVDDDNIDAQRSLLAEYPQLEGMYQPGDGNSQVLYLKDATASFYSFNADPTAPTHVVKF